VEVPSTITCHINKEDLKLNEKRESIGTNAQRHQTSDILKQSSVKNAFMSNYKLSEHK
jgi:hypothetical protein